MKKSLIFLLSIFTLSIFVSCGSTPEEEAPKPEAPVVEEVTEEVEVKDDVSVVLSQEEKDQLLAKIDEARNKAIEVGAETKAPKQLQEIDDYFASIKGNDESLKADGYKVAGLYDFLTNYIKAKDAKQEVDENNLADYAPMNYQRGSENLAAVEQAYEDINSLDESVAQKAENAKIEFLTVLTAGYKKIAKEERSLAYAEKKNADSVRAAVAQKTRYKAAVESFDKGDSLYAMQNPKKAIEYYGSAKEEFAALYKEVGEKRAAAQAAIDAAKKAVEDSNNYAAAADESSPITAENVAGIEAEDTVLLEADNYENPEDAEIDVAATFEEAVIDKAEEVVDEIEKIDPNAAVEKVEEVSESVVDEVISEIGEK